MQVTVNGEARQVDGPMTVATLLDALAMKVERVAVELNRQVVPRSLHAQTPVADGDVVEIVTFVGGG